MGKVIHNKLVRDKIAEIINNSGRKANIRILNDSEYYSELKKKLQEEVDEFLNSDNIEELADILEVIEALALVSFSSFDQVLQIKEDKKLHRGSFKSKIFLESVQDSSQILG